MSRKAPYDHIQAPVALHNMALNQHRTIPFFASGHTSIKFFIVGKPVCISYEGKAVHAKYTLLLQATVALQGQYLEHYKIAGQNSSEQTRAFQIILPSAFSSFISAKTLSHMEQGFNMQVHSR